VLRVGLIILCAGFGGIFLGSMATERLLQPQQVQLASTPAPAHKAKAALVAAKFELNSPWMPEILPSARAEYVSLPEHMRRMGKHGVAMARNAREGRAERISF